MIDTALHPLLAAAGYQSDWFETIREPFMRNAFLAGVLVALAAGVIGYFVDKVVLRNNNEGVGIGYYVTTIALDIVLGFAAAMVVAWFSRQREFRADAGAAQLMGNRQPMINALARLGGMTPGELPKSVAAFGIAGGIGQLFSTHPPIEERIAALREAR
jgi:heat shock protein HtpX